MISTTRLVKPAPSSAASVSIGFQETADTARARRRKKTSTVARTRIFTVAREARAHARRGETRTEWDGAR